MGQSVAVHAVPAQHRPECRGVGLLYQLLGEFAVAPPLAVLVRRGEGGDEAREELVGPAPDDVAEDVEAEAGVGSEPPDHLFGREDGRRKVPGLRGRGTAGLYPVLVVAAGVPALVLGGLCSRRRGR